MVLVTFCVMYILSLIFRVSSSLPWLSFLLNWLLTRFFSGSHTMSASIVSYGYAAVVTAYLHTSALVHCTEISGHFVKDQKADIISIFYDIGGIVGKCYKLDA